MLKIIAIFLLASLNLVQAQQKTVVELFTSQGCSSCPPADVFFGELNKRDNLILISWNVDYWDYLGWKDTLGDPAYSKRQRGYAMGASEGKVYTPQMIVGGVDAHVGSEKSSVEKSILKSNPLSIQPILTMDGDKITINLPETTLKPTDNVQMLLVSIADEKSVKITRGENKGETITYHRVARGLLPLGAYNGKAQTISLSRSEKIPLDADRIVVLIQMKDEKMSPKMILGAEQLRITK